MDKPCNMNPNWTIVTLLITLGASLIGCSSGNGSRKDLDLLTTSPWKYEKAGFDSNDDGVFDALAPSISGTEKDNTIIFCKDGTGHSAQGLPFMWQFQKGDSSIYFQDRYYKVRKLDRQHLEIYADEKFAGHNTRYIIILKH